jgi:hypothetical protein
MVIRVKYGDDDPEFTDFEEPGVKLFLSIYVQGSDLCYISGH